MNADFVRTRRARFGAAAAVLAAMALMAPSAHALQFTLDSYSVAAYGPPPNSDSGLEIDISPIVAFSGNYTTPDLAVSASHTFNLFEITTPEGSFNTDDGTNRPITATFAFSAPPTSGGSLTGTTDAVLTFATFFGNFGQGSVTWNNPLTFNFGTGGQFSLSLSNETFDFGPFGNDDATVQATLTYISGATTNPGPSPVPEPTSIVLLGTGLLVAARSARRRLQRR